MVVMLKGVELLYSNIDAVEDVYAGHQKQETRAYEGE
jgi:hypothetical protein